MVRVGLVGWGAIGRSIVDLWNALSPERFTLAGVCVRTAQLQAARARLAPEVMISDSISDLLAAGLDCVIEAAGQATVESHGAEILRAGCSLYLLSVGSLAPDALRARLEEAAAAGHGRVLIPAGALAGFDGLLTMRCDGLRSVKYTSAKPSNAWRGTVASASHRLDHMTERTVIFRGNARDAARLFPKNANLAAAVALAGIGFERTEVELIADPSATRNTGTLEAVSHSSTLTLTMSSNPSSNPKTSANVAASVIAALQNGARLIQFA
jgi:aspartate dehydrogenase